MTPDKVFKALGHPTRLAIINELAVIDCPTGGLSEILAIGERTLLKHLRVLEGVGLVTNYKESRNRMWRLERFTLLIYRIDLGVLARYT